MPAGHGPIPYARFKVALDRGDLGFILHHAGALPPIHLADALTLCLLYRDQYDERYEDAALRWISRFAQEAKGVSLQDIQTAAKAFDELPEYPDQSMECLAGLCVKHGLSC